MQTIMRAPLPRFSESFVADVHSGAKVLRFGLGVDGKPTLWLLVDLDRPIIPRRFEMRVDNQPLGVVGEYLGTVAAGELAFHLFDEAPQ